MSYHELKTQEECMQYLEKLRWGDTPKCPYCSSENARKLKKQKKYDHYYFCKDCSKYFNTLSKTIFKNSHVELKKWFIVIDIMLKSKKNFTIASVIDQVGVGRDTLGFMMHKIREAKGTDQIILLYRIIGIEGIDGKVKAKPRKIESYPLGIDLNMYKHKTI